MSDPVNEFEPQISRRGFLLMGAALAAFPGEALEAAVTNLGAHRTAFLDDELLQFIQKNPDIAAQVEYERNFGGPDGGRAEWDRLATSLNYYTTMQSQYFDLMAIRKQAGSEQEYERLLQQHVEATVSALCNPEDVNFAYYGLICADYTKHNSFAQAYGAASSELGYASGVSVPLGLVSGGLGTILGAIGFAASSYLSMEEGIHKDQYISELFLRRFHTQTLRAIRNTEREMGEIQSLFGDDGTDRQIEVQNVAEAPLNNDVGKERYDLDRTPLTTKDIEKLPPKKRKIIERARELDGSAPDSPEVSAEIEKQLGELFRELKESAVVERELNLAILEHLKDEKVRREKQKEALEFQQELEARIELFQFGLGLLTKDPAFAGRVVDLGKAVYTLFQALDSQASWGVTGLAVLKVADAFLSLGGERPQEDPFRVKVLEELQAIREELHTMRKENLDYFLALHDQTKSVFDAVIEVLTRINEEAYATRESIDEVKHLLLDQMNASNQIARESFSIQTLNPAVTSAKTAIATLRESPGDENGVLLAQQAAIGFFTHMRASHSLAYSARHDANIDTETFRNEVRSRFPEQLTGLVGPALQAAGLDEGFSEDLDKNGLSGIPNPYEWSQAANSLLQLRAITRSEDLPAAVEQLEGVVEDCNKVRSTVKNWITRENLEELQSCYALRVEELGRQIAEEYGAAVTARNVADPTDLRLRHRVDGWSAPFNENGEVIAPSAKIDFEPSGVRSLQRSPIMGEINFYLEELQRFGVLRIRPVHQGNRSFVYRTDIVDPRIKFGHKRSVSQTTTYLDLEFLGPGWKGIRLKSDRDDTTKFPLICRYKNETDVDGTYMTFLVGGEFSAFEAPGYRGVKRKFHIQNKMSESEAPKGLIELHRILAHAYYSFMQSEQAAIGRSLIAQPSAKLQGAMDAVDRTGIALECFSALYSYRCGQRVEPRRREVLPSGKEALQVIGRLFDYDEMATKLVDRACLGYWENTYHEQWKAAAENPDLQARLPKWSAEPPPGPGNTRKHEEVLERLKEIAPIGHPTGRPTTYEQLFSEVAKGVAEQAKWVTTPTGYHGKEDSFLPLDDTLRQLAVVLKFYEDE